MAYEASSSKDSARLLALPRRAVFWFSWVVLVFGVFNIYGHPEDYWMRPGDPPVTSGNILHHRETRLQRLLSDLRDSNDIERYRAYAEATLGRPYDARFVRLTGQQDAVMTTAPKMATPEKPLIPWRDFVVEYPPGIMPVALAPAVLTSDRDAFVWIFGLGMEIVLTLAVALAVKTADRLAAGSGDVALGFSVALTAALGVIAVRRYDPCVALAISAAVYWLAEKRFGLSGAALGVGIVLKGVPVLIAPILLLYAVSLKDWRGLARGVVCAAIVVGLSIAAYLAAAGSHALDALAYHADRPLEIKSIYSGVVILAQSLGYGHASANFAYGSVNIASPAEPFFRSVSNLAVLVSVVGIWFLAKRRLEGASDDRQRLIAIVSTSLGCLIAYISLGKVFSPQYAVWLIPLAALAAPFVSYVTTGMLIAAFALVQAASPFLFAHFFLPPKAIGGALDLVRTGLLWAYASLLIVQRAESVSPRDREAAETSEGVTATSGM